MELKDRLKQIYDNEGMENSFFICPFLTILLKHSQSGEYLWMSESFKEGFTGKVQEKNINDSAFVEDEYDSMYNDTLSAHGLNFNSSHAISQKITGSDSWLKGYIDYDGYTKEGEQKFDNSAGLVKPYYKLRQDKIAEVEQALDSIDEKDVQRLILRHKSKNYFTQEHFELLKKWQGRNNDNSNIEQQRDRDELKKAYKIVENWSKLLQETYFSNGEQKTVKNPLNQARQFSPYLWAKIYPEKKSPKILAITVDISIDGFTVKIDTIHGKGSLQNKYESVRENSSIVKVIPAEEGISLSNLKNLVKWSKQAIDKFSLSYSEVLEQLPIEQDKKHVDRVAEVDGDKVGKSPLNQILFGPPGTGKTYNTVNKAVEIIEPGFIDTLKTQGLADNKIREKVKAEFDKHLETGQIAFTTFHQSYGYEDFVEGIKAETVEKQINYSVEPGIFKQLCEKAVVSDSDSLIKLNEAIEKLKEELTVGEPLRLKTEAHKKEFTLSYRGNTAFYAKPDAGEYDNPVSIESIKKLYMDPEIKSGTQGIHFKIYTVPVIQYLIKNYNLPIYQKQSSNENKPYVLIIDEFGKLFQESLFFISQISEFIPSVI